MQHALDALYCRYAGEEGYPVSWKRRGALRLCPSHAQRGGGGCGFGISHLISWVGMRETIRWGKHYESTSHTGTQRQTECFPAFWGVCFNANVMQTSLAECLSHCFSCRTFMCVHVCTWDPYAKSTPYNSISWITIPHPHFTPSQKGGGQNLGTLRLVLHVSVKKQVFCALWQAVHFKSDHNTVWYNSNGVAAIGCKKFLVKLLLSSHQGHVWISMRGWSLCDSLVPQQPQCSGNKQER